MRDLREIPRKSFNNIFEGFLEKLPGATRGPIPGRISVGISKKNEEVSDEAARAIYKKKLLRIAAGFTEGISEYTIEGTPGRILEGTSVGFSKKNVSEISEKVHLKTFGKIPCSE